MCGCGAPFFGVTRGVSGAAGQKSDGTLSVGAGFGPGLGPGFGPGPGFGVHSDATLQPQVKLAVIGVVTDFGASDRMHAAPTAGMASWSRKVHEWHFASAVHLAQQVSLLFAFDTLYWPSLFDVHPDPCLMVPILHVE